MTASADMPFSARCTEVLKWNERKVAKLEFAFSVQVERHV
jgi:hypothetical protein